jgi:hypothetical protein
MHPYKCHHIMLMHYPDYDKSEDGGDGKVIAELGYDALDGAAVEYGVEE